MMSVLKGPADADNYRVKVGRYGDRWYTDPLPACPIAEASDWQGPSISACKPPFANKYVPMQAIANMSADEWRRLSGLEVDGRYEAIKGHDKATSKVNMARGSLIHEWAEDLLFGRPMRMPLGYETPVVEQATPFQGALQAFFDAHQPELVAAEVVCLHRTLNGVGYGGTADAIARIDGALWIIDWKSRNSDHAAYLEEAAQGGGYAGAEYMIVTGDDGNPTRALIPEVAGVLIVSIRTDGFKAYPIDRDGAIRAFAGMHRWWTEQQQFTANKVIGRPWAPKVAAGGTGTSASTATLADPPAADRDKLRARIAELIAGGYEDALRLAWPQGVAPLSKDGHTADELAAILAAVQRVERDISAPFHPDDSPPIPVRSSPASSSAGEERRELDEGGALTAVDRAAIEAGFNGLTPAAKENVARIAKEAAAAGRSISVSAHPTQRRAAIAAALLAWADDPDGLFVAVCLVTDEPTSDPDVTLGALLGALTIEQATRLHEAAAQSVAA